jgi:hypothetical protein
MYTSKDSKNWVFLSITGPQDKHVQTGYLGLESDRNRLVSPVPLRVPSPPSSFSFPAQGNSSLAARGRGSSSPAWTRGREGAPPRWRGHEPARTGERVPRCGLQVWSLDKEEDVCLTSGARRRTITYAPCSSELISTAYQPWNSVFLSQQISHSRLISQKNSLPNRAMESGSIVFATPKL